MLDTLLPKKIKSLLELIRFSKPIGFTLLMWPCWFGLAIIPINQLNLIIWYIFFLIGSFAMRSAGCIINDIVDVKIDRKVSRTSKRPLVTKEVSIFESLIFLIILLLISLSILLQFNLNSIILSIIAVPFIIIYPYMKRITYWPQLFLGVIFNWGILVVSLQFNNILTFQYIILYIGCIFWTLAYDTIYAYQDREDDIISGIKSTAVLFDDKGKLFVMGFYSFFMLLIGYIGFSNSSSLYSILFIIIFYIFILIFIYRWNITSKKESNYFFRINNLIGFFCFIYLLIF